MPKRLPPHGKSVELLQGRLEDLKLVHGALRRMDTVIHVVHPIIPHPPDALRAGA